MVGVLLNQPPKLHILFKITLHMGRMGMPENEEVEKHVRITTLEQMARRTM